MTTGHHSTPATTPTITGSETSHMAKPWMANTLRTARAMPTCSSVPPSSFS